MDGHEMTRALRAAEHAVDSHTRRTHFASIEGEVAETVIGKGGTEAAQEAGQEAIKQASKGLFRTSARSMFDNIINTAPVRATGKVAGVTVAVAGIATVGVWVFTRLGGASLAMIGKSTDDVEKFAQEKPLAAAGIGFGMLLGVTALGIMIFRRTRGGGDEE